jgi:cytochrome c oxidase subunit 2
MSDAGKPEGDDYLLKVDNPLVVPVDRKVRIITTANDVIHSLDGAGLRRQAGRHPGFVRDTWFRAEKTGDFYGQCAELCGKEHAYMPIHVKVLSGEDYSKLGRWQEEGNGRQGRRPEQGLDAGRPGARGEKIYAANCAACHQADRQGRRSDQGAGRLGHRSRRRQGQADRCAAQWRQQRRDAGLEALSDTEIAAVITYTKNNWSNKTGRSCSRPRSSLPASDPPHPFLNRRICR